MALPRMTARGKLNVDDIQVVTGKTLFERKHHSDSSRGWLPISFRKAGDDEWDYAPLMSQWERTADDRPLSADEMIARRLLRQTASDILIGPANIRLHFIAEVREWMKPDADALGWTWDHWSELLGYDGDYMRRKWATFLDQCEEKANRELPEALKVHNGHELLPMLDRREWMCRKCKVRSSSEKVKDKCKDA